MNVTPSGNAVLFRPSNAGAIWWLPLSNDGKASAEPQPTGLPVAGTGIQSITISPDGRRIGRTTFDQTSNIVAASITPTGEPSGVAPSTLTETGGARFGQPSAAADGRVIPLGSRPGTNSALFLIEGTPAPR